MFIKYNGTVYPCECKPSKTMRYRGLPDDFPHPVSGEIVLCADDGFILRKDNVDEYLRQTFSDCVLELTNVAEALPKEKEPTADDILDVLLGVR